MKNVILYLILSISCLTIPLQAQNDSDKLSLEKGSLSSQFEYIEKESSNYKNYKVIRQDLVKKIKANINDTLKVMKKDISTKQNRIVNQNSEIESLKLSLQKTNDNLLLLEQQKDSVSFLGISMSKGTYNAIMWSIIGLLLALMGFFAFRFNQSNTITKQTKRTLENTQEKFAAHQKKALEKEQKLKRELQNEINKGLE